MLVMPAPFTLTAESDQINAMPAYSQVSWPCQAVSSEIMLLSQRVGRGCQVDLPELGVSAQLHISCMLAPSSDTDWASSMGFSGAFGTIQIAEGQRLIRAITGLDLNPSDMVEAQRWSWLQAAILGRLSRTVFAAVEKLSFIAASDDTSVLPVLKLTLRSSLHQFSVYARASALVWLNFLNTGEWRNEAEHFSRFQHLLVNLPIRIARHVLPNAAFATVRTGDIILPQQSHFQINGEGHLRWGNLYLGVRYRAPAELIISDLENSMTVSNWSTQDSLASTLIDETESILEMDSLPLCLDFEMGKVQLSLGQLRNLAVGCILQIEDASPATLTIRSSGKLLGRGELVEVAGRLGVRVTQWGMHS